MLTQICPVFIVDILKEIAEILPDINRSHTVCLFKDACQLMMQQTAFILGGLKDILYTCKMTVEHLLLFNIQTRGNGLLVTLHIGENSNKHIVDTANLFITERIIVNNHIQILRIQREIAVFNSYLLNSYCLWHFTKTYTVNLIVIAEVVLKLLTAKLGDIMKGI